MLAKLEIVFWAFVVLVCGRRNSTNTTNSIQTCVVYVAELVLMGRKQPANFEMSCNGKCSTCVFDKSTSNKTNNRLNKSLVLLAEFVLIERGTLANSKQ